MHAVHGGDSDAAVDGFGGSGGDSSGDSGEAGEDACAESEFIEYVKGLLLARDINSRTFCEIMWHAGRCGLHEASKLGLAPGRPSGHYQRRVSRQLDIYSSDGQYEVVVHGRNRKCTTRGAHVHAAYPPHELVDKEIADNPEILGKLQDLVDSGGLPACYYQHPIYQQHASTGPVVPLALFVDGVPYSQTDSVVGFWMINLITNSRILICAIRKCMACRCGCRGWCTWHEIFMFLAWSFSACASACAPESRHDSEAWRDSDVGRASRAGTKLQCHFAVIYLKLDWAEFVATLGLPAWTDSVRPCPKCNCDLGNRYIGLACADNSVGPFRMNERGDHERSTAFCETTVILSKSVHDKLVPLLEYDKADGRGLIVRKPGLHEHGILHGWRVEPSPYLRDVGSIFCMDKFPAPVVFWNRTRESHARHRNPILDDARLGITVQTSLALDTLHCMNLGIYQNLIGFMIWEFIRGGLWAKANLLEERIELSLACMKVRLSAFIKSRRMHVPGERLTELHDISRKMIGEPGDQKCKVKGGEAWTLLLFMQQEAKAFASARPERLALLKAGEACESLILIQQTLHACGWVVSACDRQLCMDSYNKFLSCTESMDMHVPKRHITAHLLSDMWWLGNPRWYANWVDEGWNKQLKQSARFLSQATFDVCLLATMKARLDAHRRKHA